jgi:rhodanese-related sulfurtransferase
MTRRVSPQEAQALVQDEGYVYVDVRSVPEYEGGHPAGSYNVPFMHASPAGMQPNPDFVQVMERTFPKDAKLVLGCMSGNRSMRAIGVLAPLGYTTLVDQRAGWGGAKDAFGRVSEAGWSGAGLPTAAGPDAERGYKTLSSKG